MAIRVSKSEYGDHWVWWHDEADAARHGVTETLPATDAEATVAAKIMAADATGKMPPPELGREIRRLLALREGYSGTPRLTASSASHTNTAPNPSTTTNAMNSDSHSFILKVP